MYLHGGNALFLVVLVYVIDTTYGFLFKKTIQESIETLAVRVEELQPKEDKKSSLLLPWTLDRGTYESVVKLNFHGAPEMAAIRKNFAVNGNNMFVTAWITACLLEIQALEGAYKPKKDQIHLALDAIGKSSLSLSLSLSLSPNFVYYKGHGSLIYLIKY